MNDPSHASRPCPVCGAGTFTPLIEHPPWRLVQCAACGMAYLPEIPSDTAIETDHDWAESFSDERRRRWMQNPCMRAWTMLVLSIKPNRQRRALRRIMRYAAPGRMLDLGCGDGRLAAAALRRGFDPLGVELSPGMARKAVRRLGPQRVHVGRLDDARLAAGSFDLVTTVSYLEHEPNPLPVLRRVRELLRPGGMSVHKVPNYDSLLRRLLGRRWSGYRWPEHLQYFTPATLGRLARDAGFEVVGIHAPALSDNLWLAARRPKQGQDGVMPSGARHLAANAE